MKVRPLTSIIKGSETYDGAGVKLRRYIGSQELDGLDPFLLLDFFESSNPDDYIEGFPSHPHRGFETITYLLTGNMRHRDSTGHEGIIKSGGVQWMTAGKGIVHSEIPEQENGLLAGFQIWINLPSSKKLCDPSYREYEESDIPNQKVDGAGSIKIIAGRTDSGHNGAIIGIETNPLFLDVNLLPNSAFSQSIAADHSAFIFVIEGSLLVESIEGKNKLETSQLGVLGSGEKVNVSVRDVESRFLLLSAARLNEEVVRCGPFVMNTLEEIQKAIRDFRSGNI